MNNTDIILCILIFIILIPFIGGFLYVIFGAIVVILGDILASICTIIVKILEKYKEYKENKKNKEKKHMFLPKYWCPICNEFRSFWNTSLSDTGRECKCCYSRVRYTASVLQEFLSKDCLEKKNYYLFNMDIDIMDKLYRVIDSRIEEYESNKKSIVPDNIPLSKKEEDNYYNMVALLSSELPEIGSENILYYTTDTRRFYLYSGHNMEDNYYDVTDSLRKRSKQ